MEEGRIIIKPAVAKQFEHSMKHGRIFFLSAPCGFGKTAVAEELLRGRKVRRMQAEKPDFERAETDPDWTILLVDDLQLMQEEEQPRLCELIRKKNGSALRAAVQGRAARMPAGLRLYRPDDCGGRGRAAL